MPRYLGHLLIGCIAIACSLACAASAVAADRVELEIVTEAGTPITAAQDWAKMLGELNIGSVQIRSGRPADTADIQVLEGKQSRTYHVVGLLTSSNELLVPGRKFRISDGPRIADWLSKLADQGPAGPGQVEVPFGLRREEFIALRKTMAQPVPDSTQGINPAQIAEQLSAQLQGVCQLSRAARAKLAEAPASNEDFRGMAAGTAMAAILRSVGMGMVPRSGPRGRVVCPLVTIGPTTAVWPVGLSGEERRRQLLPMLFEFVNVEIDNFTVDEVIESISPRLNVPVLFDRWSLANAGIDSAKVTVKLPAKRTSYSALLQKMLMQAGLKFELRVDDAEQPFIWITTIKRA